MIVALIPARSGSIRIKDKNIYLLNGYPLMAYSICSAIDSQVFDRVYVSSDSDEYLEIASKYGADVIKEPLPTGRGDIIWVKNAFEQIGDKVRIFSILRPTSPFRTKETIRRAFTKFDRWTDSLRAIELCSQSPYKMWQVSGNEMKPLLKKHKLYNSPKQIHPDVYVQNASLEIAWGYCVYKYNSISGNRIRPFFTQGYEGFDINYPRDLREAEYLIKSGEAKLPEVRLR